MAKIAAPKTSKKLKSSVGAPSQRTQSSRKGKKAWRKNVDLDEVEEGLEEIRTEERITGAALHSKTNDELFQVDVEGDNQVRKRLPKFSPSQLTSLKVLSQRSAVPAVFSRPTSAPSKHTKLTHEEKGRLLRIGKRTRKGPFNGVIDPTTVGEGSALLEVSEAVKKSGTYDVWSSSNPIVEGTQEFIEGAARKVPIKAPKTPRIHEQISLSAVPAPHEGTSYNPPLESHQTLLRTAHEIEERRWKEAEELQGLKQKIEDGRKAGDDADRIMGMAVDKPGEGEGDEEEEEDSIKPTKKMPERKTKQERAKAAKRRAEQRAIAEALAKKRSLALVNSAKALRKSARKAAAAREQIRTEKQKAAEERLKKSGIAGQKVGKHTVPEGEVDVQLGEDLTESFRGLKTEGNLFRDRFLNMQQRALIEPRVPVLPKKRKAKIKEYEKHPFKRFDKGL